MSKRLRCPHCGGDLLMLELCTSATTGRRRCTNAATHEYHTTRIYRGREEFTIYRRCEEHPLGNAFLVTKIATGAAPAGGPK